MLPEIQLQVYSSIYVQYKHHQLDLTAGTKRQCGPRPQTGAACVHLTPRVSPTERRDGPGPPAQRLINRTRAQGADGGSHSKPTALSSRRSNETRQPNTATPRRPVAPPQRPALACPSLRSTRLSRRPGWRSPRRPSRRRRRRGGRRGWGRTSSARPSGREASPRSSTRATPAPAPSAPSRCSTATTSSATRWSSRSAAPCSSESCPLILPVFDSNPTRINSLKNTRPSIARSFYNLFVAKWRRIIKRNIPGRRCHAPDSALLGIGIVCDGEKSRVRCPVRAS